MARAISTLGRRWRWLRPLARRYLLAFSNQTRPRRRDVVQFFLRDEGLLAAWSKYPHELSIEHYLTGPQPMHPVRAALGWNIPSIESQGALAEWLGLTPGELAWFADLKRLGYKQSSPKLLHYHYRVVPKRSGDLRLIEAPKPRLKNLQTQVLVRILDWIPPHPAVHGFVKGRSIKTFLIPHVGKRVILRMDLRDFFPGIGAARIQALFCTAGYPESVADVLGGIATNSVPRIIWDKLGFDVDRTLLREARELYSQRHLPQGAPTSPALANLCAYRADCRLSGLAKSVGGEYTRYADDLAFSGDSTLERCVARFSTHVAAILHEEGFAVRHRKTRIMRQGVRQHLAGLVANQRVNVMRCDFDRLKATLTNCVRFGPESQNRDAHPHFCAHLSGRVGFVEMINPDKAKRLRKIFEQIEWPGGSSHDHSDTDLTKG